MPYEMSWAVEKRVIHLRFSGTVSHAELEEVNQRFRNYAEAGQPPIHTYLDTLAVTDYPHDARWIARIVQDHAHLGGRKLLIVQNAGLQYLVSTVFHLIGERLQSFATLEDAQAFLHEQDKTVEKPR